MSKSVNWVKVKEMVVTVKHVKMHRMNVYWSTTLKQLHIQPID